MKKAIKIIAFSTLFVCGSFMSAMEYSSQDKTNFNILAYTCLMDEACQKKGNERSHALDELIRLLQQKEATLEAQKAEITKMRIAC